VATPRVLNARPPEVRAREGHQPRRPLRASAWLKNASGGVHRRRTGPYSRDGHDGIVRDDVIDSRLPLPPADHRVR
jgi:hypothetical protein